MLIPGGPDEITIQLEVQEDTTFERNETLLLTFFLTPAAIGSGARIGVRNESQVTIINDDSKIHCYSLAISYILLMFQ